MLRVYLHPHNHHANDQIKATKLYNSIQVFYESCVEHVAVGTDEIDVKGGS